MDKPIIDSPIEEGIKRVREDRDFTSLARQLLERDKELLERLDE